MDFVIAPVSRVDVDQYSIISMMARNRDESHLDKWWSAKAIDPLLWYLVAKLQLLDWPAPRLHPLHLAAAKS